jgi:hypothetical protein
MCEYSFGIELFSLQFRRLVATLAHSPLRNPHDAAIQLDMTIIINICHVKLMKDIARPLNVMHRFMQADWLVSL